MKATPEHHARIAQLTFASVYPHYLTKIESKNRTKTELHQVIEWLTGFDNEKIQKMFDDKVTFEVFLKKRHFIPMQILLQALFAAIELKKLKTL